MKTLILTRHAKSSWGSATLTDFDRPLNNRGLRDAPEMGARLLRRKMPIDWLISSTAARARATTNLLRQSIEDGKLQSSETDTFYEASAASILKFISSMDEDAQCALLVGHNPGFSDTTNYLCDSANVSMPTCAMACLNLDIDRWSDVYRNCASLRWYDYPKLSQPAS